MSIQTTSGRHRARFLERMRRRVLRAWRATRRTAGPRRRARSIYDRELLNRGQVRTMAVAGGRIGCYAAPYVAAAPRAWDDVRLLPRAGVSSLDDCRGTVLAVVGTLLPVIVLLPGGRVVYREPYELELVGRPQERTLTMPAVEAELAEGSAW